MSADILHIAQEIVQRGGIEEVNSGLNSATLKTNGDVSVQYFLQDFGVGDQPPLLAD
jgi:hypothetical protein